MTVRFDVDAKSAIELQLQSELFSVLTSPGLDSAFNAFFFQLASCIPKPPQIALQPLALNLQITCLFRNLELFGIQS
ncbi:hypothetical protein GMOD_00000178 [Pyrenophora seminiperda CCB06]|uniref:Uncharacterized protein n=1 Tax=Pyrenophora seminiperda CCB06 TaxID=1302712 RepID=A0A3M7M6K6_9PLEO|nr:hypothetical protein GMOD_00000178 [Pyrenophora seminiperda CCB06]